MNQECWTAAHVNAYRYFGGVTRMIQCDNLKTGVEKHGKDEAILNKSYQELVALCHCHRSGAIAQFKRNDSYSIA